MKTKIFRSLLVVTLLAMIVAPTAFADNGTDTSALRAAVTLANVRAHQAAFQAIADANGGNRVAASSGHDASAAYVYDLLDAAGYNVSYQPFSFEYFEELSESVVNQTAPGAVAYTYLDDYYTMDYSGSASVTASVEAVDLNLPSTGGSTSGCEAADFAGFTAGNIALIQRGTCTFAEKAANAEAAGAAAVIIFNEGNDSDRVDLFGGTLGGPGINIPVLSASFAFGVALNDMIDDGLELHIETDTFMETRSTNNVIAETPAGRADRVVVVGAHLDSVAEGPGIQDNGSGSAAILEIALQMNALNINPRNKVRFMWYSAEEAGLIGSQYYVDHLSARQIRNIAVMLNFDMIASPNYARFVYDGTAGPNGSDVIEDVFLDYFADQGLFNEPTDFDGRSDYGPFIDVGIPAGGLFTGAEEFKSIEQAAIYGGSAGVAFDPCYHLACDTYANNNETALDQMTDAAAHAVLTFAMSTSSVNGTDKGKGKGQSDLEYLGSHLQK